MDRLDCLALKSLDNMNREHWILNLQKDNQVFSEARFFGFLYGFSSSCNLAQTILERAKLDPEGFLADLNGGFCGYVHFPIENKIILFNDRYGYGKVYLSDTSRGIIAGSSFNDIVRLLDKKNPDPIGILEFLRFGYPLQERTFLEEVRVLLPGSRIEIDLSSRKIVTERRYWVYQFDPDEGTSRIEKREQLWNILENSVKDCFSDTKAKYAVANSAGIDSRSVIGTARSLGIDFTAYTFGIPRSDPLIIANQIANATKVPQINIQILTDFLPKYYEVHQEKRPMLTLTSAWYYSAAEKLRDFTVNVIGMFGDNTLGIHLIDKYLKMQNEWDLLHYHSLADLPFLEKLVRSSFKPVEDHFFSSLSNNQKNSLINQFDQWNFENRQFRFIMQEAWVDFLDEMEMRCPFMHNQLVDFALRLPAEWRQGRKLYQEAVYNHLPEIGKIRLDYVPYHLGDSEISKKMKYLLWYLRKAAGKMIDRKSSFPVIHKNQKQWLLSEPNYSFITRNLASSSSTFSDLFQDRYIASNARELLETNWSVTSNLLTIKLWLDKYIDRKNN
jgi:hypothetical protein